LILNDMGFSYNYLTNTNPNGAEGNDESALQQRGPVQNDPETCAFLLFRKHIHEKALAI